MLRLADIDVTKLSPMMQQYVEIKKKYENHVVFFRLGDFYEMFFDDAITISKELELTLTGRDCGFDERAPMCGVPYHACDLYLKKLISKGFMVAICEQTTDPALSKGLVTREVVRVVTPGTLIDSTMLDESKNNYICSFYGIDNQCSLCFADISTGEVHSYTFSGNDLQNECIQVLSRYSPAEIIYNIGFLTLKEVNEFVIEKIKPSATLVKDDSFSPILQKENVLTQFNAQSYEELNIDENSIAANSIAAMFAYICDTQKSLVGRFSVINTHQNDEFMSIGFTAKRNLELIETMRNKERKGSLLWVLDKTKTSMGKRMLKSFLEQPLTNPAKIMARLDAVNQFVNSPVEAGELSECLSGVYDLERLMTRVMYKTATPRDVKALSLTALKLPEIKEILSGFSSRLLNALNSEISTLDEISALIENAIVDEPPALLKDGGVIKDGFNADLDTLRQIISGGKGIIDDIESREKERTGIKNLKIGYNRVFGYYIEVTKSYYDLIPPEYIRKQTLANCERFITEELKNAENSILGASDKILTLEAEIFNEIRDFLATKLTEVSNTATAIATIDVLASFAAVAINNNYSKPEIAIDGIIDIKNGRHPVVELMQGNEMFVPNDTYLDITDNRMSIITGPNMSGKSTYMRQVALITLMAQIGSFVPAEYAKISVVDQIFTRVGASDDLTAGQSTFMVEMSEVADILKHATKNSLVILDEVGRGTSTVDGISIARAVCEYISNSRNMGCKTLFATHYHELIELENELSGVKNYSVAVKRRGEDIKFLRKIVRGGIDESFGIEVAKLAGLPKKLITRAKELLNELNNEEKNVVNSNSGGFGQMTFENINHSIVIERLRQTHIGEMTDEELREFVTELVTYI